MGVSQVIQLRPTLRNMLERRLHPYGEPIARLLVHVLEVVKLRLRFRWRNARLHGSQSLRILLGAQPQDSPKSRSDFEQVGSGRRAVLGGEIGDEGDDDLAESVCGARE